MSDPTLQEHEWVDPTGKYQLKYKVRAPHMF